MNFWSSNYLKATNMPAIQRPPPSRLSWKPVRDKPSSRLPPPHARVDRRPPEATLGCSACHFPTKSQGPLGRILTAPSAGSRTKAPAPRPRRPSGLGVLGHHPPPGQLRPAALTHFSDRLQATRRPIVARRPATADSASSAQEPPCVPTRALPTLRASSRTPLLPAGRPSTQHLSSHP